MTLRHRRHIASGEYHAGKRSPVVLQAYLGTCVGLSLVDRAAGVGGLLHLLLPEPISRDGADRPGRYAATGVPMFIDALVKMGAAPDRLEAVVAGGALVGPVSQIDLSLDVGGRTAEVVNHLLKQNGIVVSKSETGGFFACSLTLDLQTLETRIEPTGPPPGGPVEAVRMPSREEIDRSVETLQPIPQVALKILRMIDDDDADIAALAAEVRKDQVIGAQTLRLCNSSLFARTIRIESLDEALILLGQRMFVQLVVSAAVKDFFNRSQSGYSICKGGLFHHSVGTAIIAERVARFTGKVPASIAYTAGLLHDIGKVALDQHITGAHPLFYRELRGEGNDITAIERRVLGVDHVEIGRDIAERWAFPESLVDAIAFHHEPEKCRRNAELVHVVYLADLLMTRFFTGFEVERFDGGNLKNRMAVLGIGKERFPDLIDLIPVRSVATAPELAVQES